MTLKNPLDLSLAIKECRLYADGFDAKSGYDLRAVKKRGLKALTPYQRRKLNRYYDIIRESTRRPHVKIKDKNKRRLRELQEYAQHQDFPQGLKFAFIPANPNDSFNIEWDGDKIKHVKQGGTIRKKYDFDLQRIMRGVEREFNRVVGENPPKNEFFMVQAGEHLIYDEALQKNSVIKKIKKLMEKYNARDFDAQDKNSKYYKNWMGGLVGIQAPTIKASMSHITKWRKEIKEQKEFRAAAAKERKKLARKERRKVIDRINKVRVKNGEKPLLITSIPVSAIHKYIDKDE